VLLLYHVPGDKVSLEDLGRDELRSDLNEVGRLLLPRAQILLQLIVRQSQQLLLVLLRRYGLCACCTLERRQCVSSAPLGAFDGAIKPTAL
jgi:hypothetical protein